MSFIFLSAFLSLAVSASTVTSPAPPPGTEAFLQTEWTAVPSLGAVDRSVVSALKSRFGQDDRLADVGEPFEATDIVSGHPSRRFVLGGRAGAKWFVLYERGGIGHHLVLVSFDTATGAPYLLFMARGDAGVHDDIHGWGIDLPVLRLALRNGRMRPEARTDQRYF